MTTDVLKKLVDDLSALKVTEMAQLKKLLEETWGVTAAVAAAAGPAAVGGGAAAAEEKTSFDVVLASAGGNKISVIKVVREITGLGLKEAKDMVDAAGPTQFIKKGVDKASADDMKKKLTEAGATVELK